MRAEVRSMRSNEGPDRHLTEERSESEPDRCGKGLLFEKTGRDPWAYELVYDRASRAQKKRESKSLSFRTDGEPDNKSFPECSKRQLDVADREEALSNLREQDGSPRLILIVPYSPSRRRTISIHPPPTAARP
jgi:hypothetical protein